MRYIRPVYYDDFRCVAGKCPASCCEGWQIVIDEESLQKYRNYSGEFGVRSPGMTAPSVSMRGAALCSTKRDCVISI